jgi:hypothetical protein
MLRALLLAGRRCTQQEQQQAAPLLAAAAQAATALGSSAAQAQWYQGVTNSAGPAAAWPAADNGCQVPLPTGPSNPSNSGAAGPAHAAAGPGAPAGWARPRPGSWQRRGRGAARGDQLLKSIQLAPSLLDLEDLLDSHVRSLTYVHLGAAAMRVARLWQAGGSSGEGGAAGAAAPRLARQLHRVMRQLEGLCERALPLLPARCALWLGGPPHYLHPSPLICTSLALSRDQHAARGLQP